MTYMFDVWSRQVAGLNLLMPSASRRVAEQLAGLNRGLNLMVPPASRQLVLAMEKIASPDCEQVIFRTLHETDVITGWQKFPLQVRMWAAVSVVWTSVLTYLMALSHQHQTEAASLRDSTGLDPAELAAAAACLAGPDLQAFYPGRRR